MVPGLLPHLPSPSPFITAGRSFSAAGKLENHGQIMGEVPYLYYKWRVIAGKIIRSEKISEWSKHAFIVASKIHWWIILFPRKTSPEIQVLPICQTSTPSAQAQKAPCPLWWPSSSELVTCCEHLHQKPCYLPFDQWRFQGPKMELLYHISGHILGGDPLT